jgi:hypothetical protein
MRSERKRRRTFLARFMILFMIINLLSGVNPSVLKADETTDAKHFQNYTLERTDNATGVKLTQKASNYNNGSFDVEMTVEGNEDSTTKMHSLDVVLAIDTSNSMEEKVGEAKRLDTAKKAAVSFVNGLILDGKTNVRVSVIGYGAHAYEVIGLSNKKADIVNAINSLTITGGTYTQDALKMSDSILSKSQADQKRIVLLSDGVPTYGYDGKNSGFDNAIETDNNITHPSYKIYHRKVTQKTIPGVGGIGEEEYGDFIEGYDANKKWVSDGWFKRYRFQNYRVYPGRIGDGRNGSETINNLLFIEANKIKGKDITITTVGIDVYGDGAKVLTEVAKNSGGYNGANGFGNNLKNILDKLAEEIINKRVNNGKFVIPMADFVKFKDNLTYEVTTQGKKNATLTNAIKATKPTAGDNNLVFSGLTLGKDDKLTVKYKAELVEDRKDGDFYNITKTSPELFATATTKDKIVFDKIMQVKDLKTINLIVNKEWIGNNVPSGVTEVEFTVNANGEPSDTIKVKADPAGNWSGTKEKLNRYKVGKAINYTVKEVAGDNYELKEIKKSATDNNGNITFTATNKNTEKVNFTVKKEWGNTPSELQFDTYVQLYANDKKERDQVKLTVNDNWETSFEGLPKYDEDGKEIKYSVKEVGDKEEEKEGKLTLQGYEYSVKHDTATESNQDTITNTVTNASKKTFTAKVTKKWEGGISTNSVKFTFTNKKYPNNPYTLTIEPNEGNEWNGNIELPKYNDNDNSLAEYTVEEVTVPGFTTTGGENKVVTADAPDVVFTNKINTRDITVTKDWGATPAEFIKDITVVLTGEAEGHKDIIKTMTIPVGEKSVKFTVPTHTRDGKKINYTASEQGEKDGIVTIDGKEFKVTYPEFNKIVNTYTGLEKDVVKLKIVKIWQGDGRSAVEFEVKDENRVQACKNIALNSDPWTYTVELPMWDKATGKLKTYTVNEVKTTPTFDLYPFLKEDENKISGKDKTVTFTNIRVMRKLELEKEWIGEAAGQAKFEIEGSGVSKEIELTKDKNWRGSVDLPVYDLEGNVINYTITEEPVEGYKAEDQTQTFKFVDPANPIGNRSVKFTNVELLKPQFTVHKTWVGEPASKATFGLFADGKSNPVDTLELTGGNAKPLGSKVWEGVFTKEIPAKDINGHAIKYVVKELDAAGKPVDDEVKLGDRTFNVVGTPARDTANTYNFKNTDITKTDISVTKTWFGKVPWRQLVKFGLYKENSGKLELVDKDNYKVENEGTSEWKVSFKEFPTVDEKGNKIKYVIKEVFGDRPDAVNEGNIVTLGRTDYKVSYDAQGNITNTELLNITVNKAWDESVPQSERKSVEVAIYNGGTVVASKELNSENEWKHTFTGLPYIEGGYQVKETKINGINVDESLKKLYTINVENGTGIKTSGEVKVTNSFKLPKAEEGKIKVLKQWTVNPTKEITVKLYKKTVATPAGPSIWKEVESKQLNNDSVLEAEFTEPTDAEDYQILETAIGKLALTDNEIQSILNSDDLDTVQYKIGDYEVSIQELDDNVFFIKNANDNLLTEVAAAKLWSAKTIEKNKKPVKVQLFADTNGVLEAIGSPVELNSDNQWSTKFKGLDKFDGEKEIKYYVAEVGTEKTNITLDDITNGYKLGNSNVTITGDANQGFVITNDVNLIDVTAEKVWENGATAVPVKFTLYRRLGIKLTEVASKTLDGTQGWTATFEDQPRVDETTGEDYFYYVFETEINNIPVGISPLTGEGYEVDPLLQVITYTTGDINNGRYSVVIHGNAANGEKITVKNTFKPNVVPVIPGGDTPGGIPVIPVVTPDPLPTPTPNPSTPVVDVPNNPSPQGPATPVNDGDEDNGVTEIDEDDVPQGDGKEVKKDNKANKDTVDITDNKDPKGTANLPKTGGEAGNFLSIIGLGLIGLGLVIRRRR